MNDLAALPTSWALTLWDALPLYLSIEVALAIAIVALFAPPARHRLWSCALDYPLAGVAYLLLFDLPLAAALAAIAGLAVTMRAFLRSPPERAGPPATPGEAIRVRSSAVLWSVAMACAVAAFIKIILTPAIASDSAAWSLAAGLGGLLAPGPLGVAAIPALALGTASNGWLNGTIWLAAAGMRPFVVERYWNKRTASGDLASAD
jgi:hypothetical protein